MPPLACVYGEEEEVARARFVRRFLLGTYCATRGTLQGCLETRPKETCQGTLLQYSTLHQYCLCLTIALAGN